MTGPFAQPTPPDPREVLQLPPQYYMHDIRYMTSQISRGEFCSLLGLGAVGKSTVIKMLPRWDVKLLHFTEQWAPFFVNVVLDPHLLVMLNKDGRAKAGDMWIGYELMLSQLKLQLLEIENELTQFLPNALSVFFPQNLDNIHDELHQIYEGLFKGDDLHKQAGIRHVQEAIYELLLRHPHIRLTFIFDEMEEFFNKLPPEFFQSLRGLRDMYKGRVMYITSSRAPLKDLVVNLYDPHDEAQEYKYKIMESFFELFDGQTRYMSPLDDASVQFTLQRLESRMGYSIPLRQAQQDLIRLSGSHLGLLRRGYKVAARYHGMYNRQNFIEDLLAENGVRNQCESIFWSLSESEREAVKLIANRRPLGNIPREILKDLSDKHIIHQPSPETYMAIFEIFDIWVQRQFPL